MVIVVPEIPRGMNVFILWAHKPLDKMNKNFGPDKILVHTIFGGKTFILHLSKSFVNVCLFGFFNYSSTCKSYTHNLK